MKTNSLQKTIFDVLTFVLVYFAFQFITQVVLVLLFSDKDNVTVTIASTIISSVLAMLLYTRVGWAPVSKNYLNTRPWAVLFWALPLAIGTILPLEWLYEKMGLAMPEAYEELFKGIIKQPLGYLAVGLLAPLVEEIIFRGAVLRVILRYCGDRQHWAAIALSALIFAVAHFNLAQGVHAFLCGLLLGWLYYRTHSIVPGVIFHWVNNTVAFALAKLFPQLGDAELIDFFRGSQSALYLGLAFSLCVFLPALYQLAVRMRR